MSEYPGSPSPVKIAMDMLHQYLKNVRFNIPNKEDYNNISKAERGTPSANLMVKHRPDGQHNTQLQKYYINKYDYKISQENQGNYNFMRKTLGGGRRKKTRKHRRKNKRATQSRKKKHAKLTRRRKPRKRTKSKKIGDRR